MSIDHRSEEQVANDDYHRWFKVYVVSILFLVLIVAVGIYLRGPAYGIIFLATMVGFPAFGIFSSRRMLRRYRAYHEREVAEARRRLQETDWKKKDEHVQPVNMEKENPNGQ